MFERVGFLTAGFALGVLGCASGFLQFPEPSKCETSFREERYVRVSHERAILSCVNGGGFVFMPGYPELVRLIQCKVTKPKIE